MEFRKNQAARQDDETPQNRPERLGAMGNWLAPLLERQLILGAPYSVSFFGGFRTPALVPVDRPTSDDGSLHAHRHQHHHSEASARKLMVSNAVSSRFNHQGRFLKFEQMKDTQR